jgi:hypothetical protein
MLFDAESVLVSLGRVFERVSVHMRSDLIVSVTVGARARPTLSMYSSSGWYAKTPAGIGTADAAPPFFFFEPFLPISDVPHLALPLTRPGSGPDPSLPRCPLSDILVPR